jgi:tetratricopeptide (TPR) repeat protein
LTARVLYDLIAGKKTRLSGTGKTIPVLIQSSSNKLFEETPVQGKQLFIAIILLICSIISGLAPAPSYAENLLDEGISQYKQESYEEALQSLLKAKSQNPSSSIAAFYLGLTLKQMKKYPEAENHFRDAINLPSPVKDAFLELAEVLYIQDKLPEARGWVMKAEQEGIKPAHALFLNGLILLKEGKADEAINALERAKSLDPLLSQAADFQIAAAYVKKQKYEEARKSLRTLQEMDPSSEIASFAKEYDRALERTVQMYRPWQFRVGLAYQYDDNIVLKPTTDIAGVDISGERDSSIVGTLGIIYSPFINQPYFLNCYYTLYTNSYFHTTSHNLLTQTLTIAPGLNLKNGTLSLPLSYAHVWLSGDNYMGLFKANPTLQIAVNSNNIIQFSVGYDRREMREDSLDSDENRDGNIFSLTAGYYYPFHEGKGIFSLIYEYTNDDTDGKNWANTGHRANMSILIPELFRKTDLILSGDIFLQDYKNTHTVFGKKREDKSYTASATFLITLLKGLYLNLQYTFNRDDSNVAVYDYNRNIYTVGFEYRF